MPELPEVETMVRGIRPLVEGRRVVAVRGCRCRCRPIEIRPGLRQLRRRLTGRRVVCVRRRAKRVLMELDSGEVLAIEPRMTGLMLVAHPPDRRHLRLNWLLEPDARSGDLRSPPREDASDHRRGNNVRAPLASSRSLAQGQRLPSPLTAHPSPATNLWFWDRRGLGTVRLYQPEEFAVALGPGRIGPDALAMTADDWLAACRRTSRPIKIALLDQKLVAGIGNLYASEILHAARIHPARPADRLGRRRIERLAAAVGAVLNEAIGYEGSTLGDGTYRNALNQNGGYQIKHRVYQKAGRLCPSCGRAVIERSVQAGRSTFFCPRCQGG